MVEVPGDPTATLTVVGPAATVKLGAPVTVYATPAECESVPLAPMTVTVNEPVAEPVQDKVEVPEVVVLVRETLAGVSVETRPEEGDTVSERVTAAVQTLAAETE